MSHGDGLIIADMHRDWSRFPDLWVGTARPDVLLNNNGFLFLISVSLSSHLGCC